jgi:hypothetical protein
MTEVEAQGLRSRIPRRTPMAGSGSTTAARLRRALSLQSLTVLYSSPCCAPCLIIPAQPVSRVRPPAGDAWLQEMKFDGYRCQVHKAGDDVVIFSKNGRESTNCFPGIRDAVLTLPCKSAVLDARLAAAARCWSVRGPSANCRRVRHTGIQLEQPSRNRRQLRRPDRELGLAVGHPGRDRLLNEGGIRRSFNEPEADRPTW